MGCPQQPYTGFPRGGLLSPGEHLVRGLSASPALGQAGWCSHGWDPIREPGSPAQQRLSFQNRPGPARRRGGHSTSTLRPEARSHGPCQARKDGSEAHTHARPYPHCSRRASARALRLRRSGLAETTLTGGRGPRRRAWDRARRLRDTAAQSLGGERESGGSAAPQPSSRHSRELGAGRKAGPQEGRDLEAGPRRGAGSSAVVGRGLDVERERGWSLDGGAVPLSSWAGL